MQTEGSLSTKAWQCTHIGNWGMGGDRNWAAGQEVKGSWGQPQTRGRWGSCCFSLSEAVSGCQQAEALVPLGLCWDSLAA